MLRRRAVQQNRNSALHYLELLSFFTLHISFRDLALKLQTVFSALSSFASFFYICTR